MAHLGLVRRDIDLVVALHALLQNSPNLASKRPEPRHSTYMTDQRKLRETRDTGTTHLVNFEVKLSHARNNGLIAVGINMEAEGGVLEENNE